MKRPIINIIVDTLSLMVFTVMISTGLILRFVLPPGSGGGEFHGVGGRRSIDVFTGLTRHQWGDIHFFISILFLTLLLIHIILHWAWIKAMVFGTAEHPQKMRRKIIMVFVLLWILLAILFPLLIPKGTM
ncbi:MAG: DUF4405 domain-containing protein [Candidatus Omnitrophica bacterium]|nr:DUF4405 domain-containing protein [Candidatus Omnitrophota bacterium]